MPTTFQALAIFLFFLPGVLGAVVFQSAAEVNQPSNLDKIVMAIVLALLAGVVADRVFDVPILGQTISSEATNKISLGKLIESYTGTDALIRTVIAALLGAAFAYLHNKGWVYAVLRKLSSTRQTGKMDPWHQVFTELDGNWIHLRFKDGRRLVGWPRWHTLSGEHKELFMEDATWLIDTSDSGDPDEIDVRGPGVLISNFGEVLAIEILE